MGHERCSFNVVLACSAAGEKLLPMIIFKRKTLPKENFPKGVIECVNESGWMCEDLKLKLLSQMFRRRRGGLFNQKSLLVPGFMLTHLVHSVRKCAGSLRSALVVIPGGLMKLVKSLDIGVNRSSKCHVREKWENWMTDSEHECTEGGQWRRASYVEVASWV